MNLPDLKKAKERTNKEVKTYKNPMYASDKFNGKKYFLRTYGCQMNEHDGEQIEAILEHFGMTPSVEMEDADVIVLNTCAIRENAHDKVFGYLGRIKHLKKERPDVIVAIGGCMSQEEGVVQELIKKHPYINIVFGTHNIHELGQLLIEANSKKQDIEVYSMEGDIYEDIPYKRASNITAWVNIIYGCDKFCTYCIVPYTRGKERSRKLADVVKEVVTLKEQGYQEVTLLGQNVNAYGHDLKDGYEFADLLEEVAKTNIPRVRFVTSHPWNFTDKMIEIIAKYPNIMPYIHLPLQSGSDRILKLMGRKYTKDEYINLFKKMKERIPNVAITTDIIVGFPGETKEDFKNTLEVVDTCKFDGAYTFIFSPREGTPASKMKDETPLEEKEERLYILNEKINNYAKESNEKLLSKTVPVLLLGVSEKDSTKIYGYTDTMKLVNVKGSPNDIGKIIPVYITEAKSFSLDGEEVKESIKN